MTSALRATLGYGFNEPTLLDEALTHPSWGVPQYQRLEFLGDRVLGLVVADMLLKAFPDANEGELSRRFTMLVRETCLAEIADVWHIAPHVKLGPGEPLKVSILADVVEAVLGAIYQDGGLDAARVIIEKTWQPLVANQKDEKDPKTRLQEVVQAEGNPLPEYSVVAENGPDHDKTFTVSVTTAMGTAEGSGASKQAAGAAAALALLKTLGSET